jgi:geranylgeranyl pyrophosphate synthase
MDVYAEITNYLTDLYPVCDWQLLLTTIEKTASRRPRHWELPLVTCQAVGGALEQAIPAAASVACLQMSIIHIDDLLDSDPRGLYKKEGMPAVANLAAALQSLSLEALMRGNLAQDRTVDALRNLNWTALVTAYGQALDEQNLSDEAVDEDAYWRLVRMKSSPFFGAAFYTGALAGNAPAETSQQLQQFGHLYGEVVQIHDDLKDALAIPASPDWLQGRSPLPILYAQSVAHAERERFLTLRNALADPAALIEAQRILIRCGAVSYCIDQLIGRYRTLRQLLDAMSLAKSEGLQNLLNAAAAPVSSLLRGAGMTDAARLVDS